MRTELAQAQEALEEALRRVAHLEQLHVMDVEEMKASVEREATHVTRLDQLHPRTKSCDTGVRWRCQTLSDTMIPEPSANSIPVKGEVESNSIPEPSANSIPVPCAPLAGAETPRGGASTGTQDAPQTPNRFGYAWAGGYSTPFARRTEQEPRASAGASKIPQLRHIRQSHELPHSHKLRHSHDGFLAPTASRSLSTTPGTRAGSAGPAERKPRPPALMVVAKQNGVTSPPETLGPMAPPEKLSIFDGVAAGALQASNEQARGTQASNQQSLHEKALGSDVSHLDHNSQLPVPQSDDHEEPHEEAWTSGDEHHDVAAEASGSRHDEASASNHHPREQQPQGMAVGFEESWLPSPVCSPLEVL